VYQITINHRSGEKTYDIYTQKEADEKDIPYKPWKESREGDYALSDDGYCAPVLKRQEYTHPKGYKTVYFKLPFGYHMWDTKYGTRKFYAEGRYTPHTFTGKDAMEVKTGLTKWKNLAMMYAFTRGAYGEFNEDVAIDLAFGTVTPKDRRRWKRNMKHREFRKMVREEVAKLLDEHGLGPDRTMELLSDAVTMALDKKDLSNLNRIIENLEDLHGMKDKNKVVTTTQLEATETQRMLDEVTEEERKLVATQVESKDVKE
jgi:hypothetical protein|tara:strand:- start:595 stop:1371 length:777 start_codon:yes stop_codon:yes gene_type:complete